MAAVHLTTIPCECSAANKHIEGHIIGEFRPCINNIVYARFEDFMLFLCVFMSVLSVFLR